jgi:uncharacterized protein YjiS (DUF1127 family)
VYNGVKFEARQNAGAQKSKEENIMNPLRIVANYVNYRRTIAELSNLSNDTLSDIGVNRYQIRNIAARSFR